MRYGNSTGLSRLNHFQTDGMVGLVVCSGGLFFHFF